jgi:nicotinamide-nucleotide amidase
MQMALLTVGDELLSGDTENTHATWLAQQLAKRGVATRRIAVVPDEVSVIATHVNEYKTFDAVIVTGGIGRTPDDVTMEGVADAFDRPLEPNDLARTDIEQTVTDLTESHPDTDFEIDIATEASIPRDARPLINDAGLSPGCVVENVYVLPGIPEEMRSMFRSVADEFAGDIQSRTFYTEDPESNLVNVLSDARDKFDVGVGCYPNRDAGHNRLKLSGADESALDAAEKWLRERVTVADPSE